MDGDIAIISTGHTVTVDVDSAAGSNGSNIGDAVTINATDATTFGKLIVADGVTLTLKGNGTASNRAMLINRYAMLEPAPGARINVDCASNFQTIIDNRGIINAIGTGAKPITFGCPAANYSWNNDAAGESFSGTAWKFDSVAKVAAVAFTNLWIANAAGTGLGSLGDSSVSFGGTNAAAFGTEVASLALVVASGDYYINYDLGIVWFYWDPAGGNPAFTKTYKYLTNTKGWGITASQSNTYNEAKFDYCVFEYMGPSTAADKRVLDIQNKKSATSAANRLFYLKNSTFRRCYQPVGLKACDGTSGDPLLIQGNTFGAAPSGGGFGTLIVQYRSQSTYVSIIENDFTVRAAGIEFLTFGSVLDFTGYKINDNTALIAGVLVGSTALLCRLPAGEIKNNIINGVGSATDYRTIASCGGSSGSPLVIENNTFRRVMRTCHYSSYLRFRKNIIDRSYHHGFVAPTEDDLLLTDIECTNNAFIGEAGTNASGYDDSPSVEIGYNHRHHIDDLLIAHNTFQGNHSGAVGFGDMQDFNTFAMVSRIRVLNNLCSRVTSAASEAWRRRAISAGTAVFRGHVEQFDYNLDYNVATRYENINRQGTWTGLSTVTGVSLYDPNFATASGKTLDFTYTSATDQTLTYDGGTPIQLVLDSGTATAGANTSTSGVSGVYNGTLTDSGKSWNTSKGNAACPSGHWIVITGGTGSGQVRAITNNTATVLTCVPGWSVVPDNTSTYTIIKSEVELDDSSDTVRAGIYAPLLPTSTEQDTGIAFADHSITGSDPLLIDPGSSEAAADYAIETGSPAIDAGTTVAEVTDDYFGDARDGSPDIGFDEFAGATSYTFTGPSEGTVNEASTNFTVTPNGDATGIEVTPASDGAGSFTPASVTFTGSGAETFTYTPTSTTGSPHTLSVTDDGGLTDPASIDYTVNEAGGEGEGYRSFRIYISGSLCLRVPPHYRS